MILYKLGAYQILLILSALLRHYTTGSDVTLTILHTNDVHARFLQTSAWGGHCTKELALNNKCYGGFPRIHSKVTELRRRDPDLLYFSVGDYFQGTTMYSFYKWRAIARYVNMLNHTAMTLGNHEFDDKLSGLVPFLDSVTFPIVVSNIDDSLEPSFQGKVKKSIIVHSRNVPVGIVGYVTPETPEISRSGKLIFTNELDAISREAKLLHEKGIKIIIALGHSGYEEDIKIAEKVPYVDLIVGGHSHTFLHHGPGPLDDKPEGDYPTVVTQSSGRKVLVVQALCYGKYLGHLNVTFNEDGDVVKWGGNPILMDHLVPEDPDMLESLTGLNKRLADPQVTKVAITNVYLRGYCHFEECSLGNVVTDAMVHAFLKPRGKDPFWSDVTMAILPSTGTAGSFNESLHQGIIRLMDVLLVLPHNSRVDVFEIRGEHLLQLFEVAVKDYQPKSFQGADFFLQVSGIKLVFDVRQPKGSRVKSLQVLCKHCRIPRYTPLQLGEVYKVAAPRYYIDYSRGHIFNSSSSILSHYKSDILDVEMLIEYLGARSPITQGVEGRIMFDERPATTTSNSCL